MQAFLDRMGDINMAAFCLLALACGRQCRRPDAGIRWATAAFGSLAGLSILARALDLEARPELSAWVGKGMLLILCLFPYLLYRFASAFQPVGRSVATLAAASTMAVAAATCALPSLPLPIPGDEHPWWWMAYRLLIVGQWTILFSTVAVGLWSAARHESRVPRLRMRTLAVAAAGLNGAILLSGAGTGPTPEPVRAVVAVLLLTCSILFFIGLSPPAVLVQAWLRPVQLALQHSMGALFRAETQAELCAALLPHAHLVGGRAAALVSPTGAVVGRFGDTGDDAAVAALVALDPDQLPVGVRCLALRAGTLVVWTSAYAPFFDDAGMTTLAALGHFSDIVTDRCALVEAQRQAKIELAHQATHDPLTGLPNRVLLQERLAEALVRADGSGRRVAVLFLDIDRFKAINDSLGHSLGDEVLRAVGRRLQGILRPGDTVARLGGDEFVLVAEGPFDDVDPGAIARRIAHCLHAPIQVGGTEVPVTVSTGVVVAGGGDDPDTLLRDADVAMYVAKDAGRDRYLRFHESMRQGAERRHQVEAALREAIEQGTVLVRYQPTVELATGRVVGVEALARCPFPGEELRPDEFIPIAEETGLITGLGEVVLRKACDQVRRWQQDIPGLEDLTVSVNQSARELLVPDATERVGGALRASRLAPDRLCLEITESVLLEDAPSSARALSALKQLGVQIAVDDFGTGYSSLTYLKQFPVDVLKIDRSFVWGLDAATGGPGDRAIVAGVIDLAHAFGLIATAEGVETAQQLEDLEQLGCELAQGYFLGLPMTPAEATDWLVAAQRDAPAPVPAAGASPDRVSVLLVDDDAAARTLVRLSLDDGLHRYEIVAEAADGREAVAAARHHQPDLVVLDLAMPGVGGLSALPLIRAVAPTAEVVVLSAVDDPEVRRQARTMGARAVVDKGCDPDRLLRELDLVIPRGSLGRAERVVDPVGA